MTIPKPRIFLIAGAIALVVLVIWKAPKNTRTSEEQGAGSPLPTTSSASTTPGVTPPTITYGAPGADWQKFSSASLGFSVTYPKNWKLQACGAGCIAWAQASAPTELIAGISTSRGALSDILTKAAPYVIASGSVTFNKIQWTRLTLQEPQTGSVFTSHYAVSGPNVIEFGINTTDTTLLGLYGKMVQSFTFLKK